MESVRCDGELFHDLTKSVTVDGKLLLSNNNKVVDVTEQGWVPWSQVKAGNGQYVAGIPDIFTQARGGQVNMLALYTYYYHEKRTYEELEKGVRPMFIDSKGGFHPDNVRWSDEQRPADDEDHAVKATHNQDENVDQSAETTDTEDDAEAADGQVIGHPQLPSSTEATINRLAAQLSQLLALQDGDFIQICPAASSSGKPSVKVYSSRADPPAQ